LYLGDHGASLLRLFGGGLSGDCGAYSGGHVLNGLKLIDIQSGAFLLVIQRSGRESSLDVVGIRGG
jgi:hypothetical protein